MAPIPAARLGLTKQQKAERKLYAYIRRSFDENSDLRAQYEQLIQSASRPSSPAPKLVVAPINFLFSLVPNKGESDTDDEYDEDLWEFRQSDLETRHQKPSCSNTTPIHATRPVERVSSISDGRNESALHYANSSTMHTWPTNYFGYGTMVPTLTSFAPSSLAQDQLRTNAYLQRNDSLVVVYDERGAMCAMNRSEVPSDYAARVYHESGKLELPRVNSLVLTCNARGDWCVMRRDEAPISKPSVPLASLISAPTPTNPTTTSSPRILPIRAPLGPVAQNIQSGARVPDSHISASTQPVSSIVQEISKIGASAYRYPSLLTPNQSTPASNPPASYHPVPSFQQHYQPQKQPHSYPSSPTEISFLVPTTTLPPLIMCNSNPIPSQDPAPIQVPPAPEPPKRKRKRNVVAENECQVEKWFAVVDDGIGCDAITTGAGVQFFDSLSVAPRKTAPPCQPVKKVQTQQPFVNKKLPPPPSMLDVYKSPRATESSTPLCKVPAPFSDVTTCASASTTTTSSSAAPTQPFYASKATVYYPTVQAFAAKATTSTTTTTSTETHKKQETKKREFAVTPATSAQLDIILHYLIIMELKSRGVKHPMDDLLESEFGALMLEHEDWMTIDNTLGSSALDRLRGGVTGECTFNLENKLRPIKHRREKLFVPLSPCPNSPPPGQQPQQRQPQLYQLLEQIELQLQQRYQQRQRPQPPPPPPHRQQSNMATPSVTPQSNWDGVTPQHSPLPLWEASPQELAVITQHHMRVQPSSITTSSTSYYYYYYSSPQDDTVNPHGDWLPLWHGQELSWYEDSWEEVLHLPGEEEKPQQTPRSTTSSYLTSSSPRPFEEEEDPNFRL